MDKKIGHHVFVVGAVLAIVTGLITLSAAGMSKVISVLVLLGVISGLLTINHKETKEFLLAITVIAILAFLGQGTVTFGKVLYVGEFLERITLNILALVVPAGVVVALKNVYELEAK